MAGRVSPSPSLFFFFANHSVVTLERLLRVSGPSQLAKGVRLTSKMYDSQRYSLAGMHIRILNDSSLLHRDVSNILAFAGMVSAETNTSQALY